MYINVCLELRKKAKTSFESLLFKIMINSIYGTDKIICSLKLINNNLILGKFLQNSRKFISAVFIHSRQQMERAACNPLYTSFQSLHESLVIGYAKPKTINLARPYLTGNINIYVESLLLFIMFYL